MPTYAIIYNSPCYLPEADPVVIEGDSPGEVIIGVYENECEVPTALLSLNITQAHWLSNAIAEHAYNAMRKEVKNATCI